MGLRSAAAAFFVVVAAITGGVVHSIVPGPLREPALHDADFQVTRTADQPLELTDGKWTLVPLRFPDFDLRMQVELGEGVDLDVLVRQVEPRLEGEEMLPFTGRFSVLRISTVGDGPGWRTRDEAVLGPRGGGVGVTPGVTSSVWIEGRGRDLTANVAGKTQPAFSATDEYGMFALVARGGKAVVHGLAIGNRGRPGAWRFAAWTWIGAGAVGGALIALLAWRRNASLRWFLLAGLPMPALAWLVRARADLDLAFPPPEALAAVLAGCLLVGKAQVFPLVPRLLLAVLAAIALAAGDRRLRHDDAAIEAAFGPDAGAQVSEAHAQLLRGPNGLTAPQRDIACVFLLGGQLLYDRGLPEEHLAMGINRWLRSQWAREVLVPSLPTIDGHCAQQWRLFTTCYTGFRPQAIVLGVPRDEMALDRTGVRRSSAAQVRETIAAARTFCASNGSKLLVFADSGLPAELVAVVRAAAAEGVAVVEAIDGRGPIDIGQQLGKALEALLK